MTSIIFSFCLFQPEIYIGEWRIDVLDVVGLRLPLLDPFQIQLHLDSPTVIKEVLLEKSHHKTSSMKIQTRRVKRRDGKKKKKCWGSRIREEEV